MKDWWSISELHALGHNALPGTVRRIRSFAETNWHAHSTCWREVEDNGGTRREYHRSLFPGSLQVHITHLEAMAEAKDMDAKAAEDAEWAERWDAFARASEHARSEAELRLQAVTMFLDLELSLTATVAYDYVARKLGVSARSVMRWRDMVGGVEKRNWLVVLMPSAKTGRKKTDLHPDALQYIITDYVRNEGPSFKSCYDRLKDVAAVQGWGKLPSWKTLKRRVEDTVGYQTIVYWREGKDRAMRLFPAQERDKSCFHAMQGVNSDGHVADTWVLFPDGEIMRPTVVGFQDLYSNAGLSFRVGKSEDSWLIQLAAADMIEQHGIPEDVWFDNGAAFWSKHISGGATKGFRKKEADEPLGMLPKLGVTIHATTVYWGQAKPIERLWKDLCDRVAKHPACAGAYTGKDALSKPDNYKSKAVPLETYEQLLAREVERYNEQTGRNTRIAAGGSYGDAFRESLEHPDVLIARATPLQKRLMYLAREDKLVRKPDGAIHMLGNRYWNEDLNELMGKRVTVRYDPQNPTDDLFVYTMKEDRFITAAQCIHAAHYNDPAEAKRHSDMRNSSVKRWRSGLADASKYTVEDIAAMTPGIDTPGTVRIPKKQKMQKVVGLNFQDVETPYEGVDAEEGRSRIQAQRANDGFSRGVTASLGVTDIFDVGSRK
ncbi:transposase domain-containing protein [Halocynthiibacter styelae]|uniref:Mu transposase C-terminal domain-containing protein n=1 Tax=Halocynthiibacter styelae TaxID=2761955 RepID=A0A8J7J8J5_9RHOB|nr:transposase domain-containing protein [Paenihalocynthiibacter styelae]MBI1495375.1 Mu transposase C-terminal domain-containing protein [Paenihalocynthiibacter styelae]